MDCNEKNAQKCGTCVYRAAEFAPYSCEYAYLMGKTRKAQPPAECTYYKNGARTEKPIETISLKGTPKDKKDKVRRKTKFDYEKGRGLYEAGRNDGEIARALGCRPANVRDWRVREGLPANAASGAPYRAEVNK